MFRIVCCVALGGSVRHAAGFAHERQDALGPVRNPLSRSSECQFFASQAGADAVCSDLRDCSSADDDKDHGLVIALEGAADAGAPALPARIDC